MKIISLHLKGISHSVLVDYKSVHESKLASIVNQAKLKLLVKAMPGESLSLRDLFTYDSFFEVSDYTSGKGVPMTNPGDALEKKLDLLFGFSSPDGSYVHCLTRVKEAKQYGTLTIDDFEEMTPESEWVLELKALIEAEKRAAAERVVTLGLQSAYRTKSADINAVDWKAIVDEVATLTGEEKETHEG